MKVWNELANSIATWCRESVDTAVPLPKVTWCFKIVEANLEWSRLVPLSIRTGSAPFPAYGRLTWDESVGPLAALQPTQLIPTVELPAGSAVTLSVRTLTANIQSGIGKIKFLEDQLATMAVNILCAKRPKAERYFSVLDPFSALQRTATNIGVSKFG